MYYLISHYITASLQNSTKPNLNLKFNTYLFHSSKKVFQFKNLSFQLIRSLVFCHQSYTHNCNYEGDSIGHILIVDKVKHIIIYVTQLDIDVSKTSVFEVLDEDSMISNYVVNDINLN